LVLMHLFCMPLSGAEFHAQLVRLMTAEEKLRRSQALRPRLGADC
jgi:hypothetical protein